MESNNFFSKKWKFAFLIFLFLRCPVFSQIPIEVQGNIDEIIGTMQKTWIKSFTINKIWTEIGGTKYVKDTFPSIIFFSDFEKVNCSTAIGYFQIVVDVDSKLKSLVATKCSLELLGKTCTIYFENDCKMEIHLLSHHKMIIATSESDDCDVLIEEEYFPYKQ